MSKIYESLLQAELERLRSGAAPGDAKESDATLQTETPQPETTPSGLNSSARAANGHSRQPASGAAPAAVAAFPWDRIAVRSWKPSLPQLPSLLRTAPEAEQFRSLRARLYEYRDFNKLKSVLVSSGMPQEGKSFVAANLALILAHQRASKVLLIDADLRRYSLDKVLGCEVSPGLADYLSGKAEPIDIMQRADVPRPTEDKPVSPLANLTLIPAGVGGEAVADLGTNGRFRQLLDEVGPAFDWVIVDSSPVNLVSDAVHYAHECDGVLLVVRSGVTKYEVAQRAQAEFKAGSVIGVVLNASTDAPASGYYGYGYAYETRTK
jgi:capsular exopolysaccharide synthesis family protein